MSLPPVFERGGCMQPITKQQQQPVSPKIKHAFSSDFGSKTFLIVDKNSNQRYQMVPTAENEELVDDNQEIIQMHNGRAHRYAVIPTEEEDEVLMTQDEEEETCLSNQDFNRSENFFISNTMETPRNTTLRTSTPQKPACSSQTTAWQHFLSGTPLKNPAATKSCTSCFHTSQDAAASNVTPRNLSPMERLPECQQQEREQHSTALYYTPGDRRSTERTAQSLHYESVKTQGDRTMAVINPRITANQTSKVYPEVEEEDAAAFTESPTTPPHPTNKR
ncbi:unnamed protein product [Ceratitis capitata]|uniref:(Mediterranean fruit fly) hypothetical protein n=1 Tax=Ceratitis capitata TaxID=7213 RepID=A0A811U1X8_CERCA|nr:unnamed protein product [Ceratitis capitata]